MIKSILFFCLLLPASTLFAQKEIYREEQDQKPYYFSISLGSVFSRFQIDHHPSFLQQDSILVAEPVNTPGIRLGLAASVNVSPRFELRFNPSLIFTERPIVYKLKYPVFDYGTDVRQSVESIITSFPLSVKFKSDRIGNFRVYMLAGGKADLDMASNAQKRKADDQIRIKKLSYGIEAGLGFNFYLKSVTVSPELKISNGLNDLHDRNPALNYSRMIDQIKSRMIMFTIHLEG